jgi:hypothetical protein
MAAFKESMEMLASHLITLKKDALDRVKRRWEALCAGCVSSRRISLEDVPPYMDGIPNPFDR